MILLGGATMLLTWTVSLMLLNTVTARLATGPPSTLATRPPLPIATGPPFPIATGPPVLSLTCPDSNWTSGPDGQSCLRAVNNPKSTWDDARIECARSGADLVQISDPDTNSRVQSLLTRGNRYWIGLSDTDEDDAFEYINGDPIASFHPWASREPNNRGGNERCVEIIANNKGSWNDKRCSKKRPFVCEKIMSSTTSPRHTTVSSFTPTTTPSFETTEPTVDPSAFLLTTNLEVDDLPRHYLDVNRRWRRLNDIIDPGAQYRLRNYIMIVPTGDDGLLISQPVNITLKSCMTVAVRSSGGDHIMKAFLNGVETARYTSKLSDAWSWKTFHFDIPRQPPFTKLSFWVGSYVKGGYMDVDDFRYHPGTCASNGYSPS